MNKEYGKMELNILSCLILEPDLMEKLFVKDEHFKIYKRLWLFMKSFYGRFKTFDIPLMYSMCSDRKDLAKYLEWAFEHDALPIHFKHYQERLIEMSEESVQQKYAIDKIFELANDLYLRKIDLREFEKNYRNILEEIKSVK